MEKWKLRYYTITEGFDYGPSVSKLVIEFGGGLDVKDIKVEQVTIQSIRTVPNENGFKRIEGMCGVEGIHLSDKNGNEDSLGNYISINLETGPERIENSPFHYDFVTGRNMYIDHQYKIDLTLSSIGSKDGKDIHFCVTGEDYLGNTNVLCDEFQHNKYFQYEDIDLLYASYRSTKKNEEKVPLIIWLHGAGEGGKDTRLAVFGNRVTRLISEDIQKHFGKNGAYVLIPQSPTMWMDIDGSTKYNIEVKDSDGKSYYTDALMHLIEHYINNNPNIDKNRIYVGGCSNGGYMTIQMLVNFPNYFAAAYPICEAYHREWLVDSRVEILTDVPMWIVHSKDDPVIPVHKNHVCPRMKFTDLEIEANSQSLLIDHYSNALYTRLKEKGANDVHYSLYERVIDTSGKYFDEKGNPYEYHGHFSWIYALNNECVKEIDGEEISLFKWLSKQSK